MASTQQQQRETATKISDAFVKAYNTGDATVLEPYVTDEFVCHHMAAGVDLKGISEYAGRIKEMQGAFDDFELSEDLLVVEGDTCAGQYRWSGKHTGTFQGIAPTNESIETTSIALMKMDDGKLGEMWIYGDSMGLMRQLGVETRPGK
jgi:steroid delta-isomerase-like uncharacterized protein